MLVEKEEVAQPTPNVGLPLDRGPGISRVAGEGQGANLLEHALRNCHCEAPEMFSRS